MSYIDSRCPKTSLGTSHAKRSGQRGGASKGDRVGSKVGKSAKGNVTCEGRSDQLYQILQTGHIIGVLRIDLAINVEVTLISAVSVKGQ